MAKKSIYIAVPAYGFMVGSKTVESLLHTVIYLVQNGIESSVSIQSYPDVTDARSFFTTSFYDMTEHTHLLFVDADVDYPWELIRDMLGYDQPIMGTTYPYKKFPLSFVGVPPDDTGRATITKGFMKMRGVGCGVMMIQREVIRKMIENDPSLVGKTPAEFTHDVSAKAKRVLRVFDRIEVDGYRLSEDLSFCRRWVDMGGEVWANINYKTGHTGMHNFSGRYADLFDSIKAANFPTLSG